MRLGVHYGGGGYKARRTERGGRKGWRRVTISLKIDANAEPGYSPQSGLCLVVDLNESMSILICGGVSTEGDLID